MSGGVDSSVSALLLAQEDYDLSAVYMRNWDTRDESGTDKGCEWEKDWEDVQLVCRKLGLPCELVDLSKEYWNRVFEPSLRQWEAGVSPNPDVWCNREIKFGALLEKLPIGKDPESQQNTWFATGHYASKAWSSPVATGSTQQQQERPRLLRPTDKNKDQTYFLSAISESALQRALFPVGHLTKPEVRELAKKHQLPTAERPDSVGICFVGERGRFGGFLGSYIPPNPGPIIDKLTGKAVGTHQGLWNFTIGENARVSGLKHKMFVAEKDVKENAILVVPGSTHQSLFTHVLNVPNFTWIWKHTPPPEINSLEGADLMVQHRYRMEPQKCNVKRMPVGALRIECEGPQQSVSPGQIATLWDGDWCLGCGVIESSS
ncbi:tRNA-specific 2-thiouridylase [Gymnopilus junonius]|uniref:tRNA-5-taurinomethyluridine 2-sulfurtransferase n=1 Tax=Gymnopilus junonius TaxID=109634 RepID=A0A9P5NXW9_GYMJU|nr:tRNA-specific 2-thiouridylase [Gymnopilus junonius]